MPYIGNTPALDYISYAVQNFTVTAATTVYTLDYSVSNENDIRLVINNVIQRPGVSYAYSATGTTLTLTSATLATDTMYAVFIGRAVQTVTPPANINIQLADGTAAAPSLNFANDTNTGIFRPTTDSIGFAEGGTEGMRITSDGNIGVNTTPTAISGFKILEVKGSTTNSGGILRSTSANGTYSVQLYTASAEAYMYTDQAIPLVFYNSGTERMRIPSGGGLAVGTTSTGTAFMRVLNTSATGRMLEIVQESTSSTTDGSVYSYIGKSSGTDFVHYTAQSLSQVVFKVFGNGNVQNLNNSYGSLSDIKIKKDIIDAGSQWNDIKNVRVRKFRLKDDPTQFFQIGVVAQELEEVSPNLIDEIQDYEKVEVPVLDDNGNPVLNEDGTPQVKEERIPLDTTTKSVKYSVLYMKAVKALQEAMERIEQLETKNTNLEARLTALENN